MALQYSVHEMAEPEVVDERAAAAPNLFLIGGAAGVLTGLLEFAYAAPSGGWQHRGSVLLLLAVTCSLLGFCGCLYGGLLQLVHALSTSRLALRTKLLLVVLGGLAAASRYRPLNAAVIAAVLLLGVLWAWWRASERGCAVMLAWALLLYVLNPLFNGHAMDRVFSEAETESIFVAVVCLLPFLAAALVSATTLRHGASTSATAVRAGTAVLLAAALTAGSSVFLVRLWGFNTMEYLEATLLGLKIGCLAVSLTLLFAYWPVRVWRSRREANLIGVLVLLVLFVLSAYAGMRHDPTARMLLAQLPDTSFIATRIAGLLDRDRDGYSGAFGFGDCDDTNPDVNPGAIDWPGDGIDQNCFGGDLASAAHPYFNLPIAVTPPESVVRPRRKIVVFVLLDTLRADAVNYTGGAGTPTPELAKIAAHSRWFDHAYAQSNNTLESLPYLLHLGFRDFPRYHQPWTLVSQFKAGGVASVGVFQSAPRLWFSELDDVFTGFDRKLYPDERIGYRSNHDTAALAVEQLTAPAGSAPLFMWVHFESLHDSFTQLMEGDRIRSQGLNLSELARLWDMPKMVGLMKERYLTTLADVDRAMGVLWDGIQRAEADADVLLVITSDHGEEFYDHGGLFHMGTLHEELVRVPLMLYQTGGEPGRDSLPVGLYRLPGTVLKWLGYGGTFLDEMDLLRTPPAPYDVFGYFAFGGDWERRTFMVLDEGHKLTYDTGQGRLELYNLADDPHENHNLAGDAPQRAVQERLMAKMDTTMFYMNYGDMEYARRLQARARAAAAPQSAAAE